MNSEVHVANVPSKELNAYLAKTSAEDPAFVYYGVTLPLGYDPEADRVRTLGLVQVFKQERPTRIVSIDKELHNLIRVKSERTR